MDIMQLLTGLVGAGFFTAGYKIIELWARRRHAEAEAAKWEAERDKLEAEGDRLRGQTWQEAYTWLAKDAKNLRDRVTDLEHRSWQPTSHRVGDQSRAMSTVQATLVRPQGISATRRGNASQPIMLAGSWSVSVTCTPDTNSAFCVRTWN